MSNPANPADGKYVVIQNGQRVSQPQDSKNEAQREADRLNRLQEGSGHPVPEGKQATVKQNLFG